MTGNEDLTVQFGEDPPWDDLPPVDREKANKELEWMKHCPEWIGA